MSFLFKLLGVFYLITGVVIYLFAPGGYQTGTGLRLGEGEAALLSCAVVMGGFCFVGMGLLFEAIDKLCEYMISSRRSNEPKD